MIIKGIVTHGQPKGHVGGAAHASGQNQQIGLPAQLGQRRPGLAGFGHRGAAHHMNHINSHRCHAGWKGQAHRIARCGFGKLFRLDQPRQGTTGQFVDPACPCIHPPLWIQKNRHAPRVSGDLFNVSFGKSDGSQCSHVMGLCSVSPQDLARLGTYDQLAVFPDNILL